MVQSARGVNLAADLPSTMDRDDVENFVGKLEGVKSEFEDVLAALELTQVMIQNRIDSVQLWIQSIQDLNSDDLERGPLESEEDYTWRLFDHGVALAEAVKSCEPSF